MRQETFGVRGYRVNPDLMGRKKYDDNKGYTEEVKRAFKAHE